MTKTIWLMPVLLLLGYGLAAAQLEDLPTEYRYGLGDTVYLDSVCDISPDQYNIPFAINFVNEDSLGAMRVPLSFYNPLNTGIYLDSVSWKGSRVDYVTKKEMITASTTSFDDKRLLLSITPFPDEMPIPPGTGLLCTLYFRTGHDWDPAIEVEVDTTRVNHVCLSFVHKDFICRWMPNLPWKGLLAGKYTDISAEAPNTNVPQNYRLHNNYPNPFNAATAIQFSIPIAAHVKLDIFSILGRRVKTLINTSLSQGTYTVEWDGRDDEGNAMSSAIYFCRMRCNDIIKVERMTLLR